MITKNNYWLWYEQPFVKYKMIPYLFNRETGLLSKQKDKETKELRYLRIHNTQSISLFLKVIQFNKFPFMFYYSLGKYRRGIPKFSLNLSKRNTTDWKLNHWREMESYDFLIDIDAKNFQDLYDEAVPIAKQVCNRLEEHNIPYDLRFSGKGFHIVVPYSYFENKNLSFDPTEDENIFSYLKTQAKGLRSEYGSRIDIINDPRRLCKVPYGLAMYDNSILVCKPIRLEDLGTFNLDDYKPSNVLKWLQVVR